jgi:hypothetical protein
MARVRVRAEYRCLFEGLEKPEIAFGLTYLIDD